MESRCGGSCAGCGWDGEADLREANDGFQPGSLYDAAHQKIETGKQETQTQRERQASRRKTTRKPIMTTETKSKETVKRLEAQSLESCSRTALNSEVSSYVR